MVVLAGYKNRMDDFMAADPGLPRRFALSLHLQDYSAAELADIVQSVVTNRLGLRLADDLPPLHIAVHIAARHADEIPQHNGGLAVRLAEAAFGRLAERVVDCGLSGAAAFELSPSDFAIGQLELGASPVAEAGAARQTNADEAARMKQLGCFIRTDDSRQDFAEDFEDFGEVLEAIGIGRHAEKLAAECIVTGRDLRLLGRADCVALGLMIGETNRLLAWAACDGGGSGGGGRAGGSGGPLPFPVRLGAGGGGRSVASGPRRQPQQRLNEETATEEAAAEEVAADAAAAVDVEPASGLFAAVGQATRLAFAIDVSGSMAKPCAGGGAVSPSLPPRQGPSSTPLTLLLL